MKILKIYDPAMCCSSGVCGPNVNEKLVQLSGFLKGLDKDGYQVERYNLSQEPSAYVQNQQVAQILKDKGTDALPLIFVDDEVVCSGEYPSIDELAELLKVGCMDVDETSSCCSSGECC